VTDAATLSSVDDAIAALAAGRAVVLVDDAEAEAGADLLFAARDATAEVTGFLVRHTSGYVCAALDATALDRLGLPGVVEGSGDAVRGAADVSVDARGIAASGSSAADRALTLRTLADPDARAEDLVRPGHVMALRAVTGGVLRRAGHTEAAVDLVRLAGLGPVAALSELVHDDGETMRGLRTDGLYR